LVGVFVAAGMKWRVEHIGDATLYLGDCLEILPTLQKSDPFEWMTEKPRGYGDNLICSLVTDPPYGINYQSGHATNDLWGSARRINQDENTMTRDAVVSWARGLPALFFGTWRAPRPEGTRQVLIWDKGGALGMGALDLPWKPDHEEIYVLGKGFCGNRDSGSVLRHPPVQSMAKNGRVHPTEKPLCLLLDLIRKVYGPVLDPFMGSGTTGVACAKMGRKFIGIEISEEYFNIAVKRITDAYRQGDLFIEQNRKQANPEQMPLLRKDV